MDEIFGFLWLACFAHILWVWASALLRGLRARKRSITHFAGNPSPLVSVIIPAWMERSVLKETLASLKESDYPNFEAIVVAGGPDGTLDYARELCNTWPAGQVLEQPPHGKNAALNMGLAHAKGNIILLLDADTIIPSDWIARLSAPIANREMAATSICWPRTVTPISMTFVMEKLAAYRVRRDVILSGNSGIAIHRSVLEQLGGFPEDVTVGVDWDLDQRIKAIGLQPVYVEIEHSTTVYPPTLRAYARNELRWRRAHIHAAWRNRNWKAFTYYLAALAFWAAPPAAALLSLTGNRGWEIWPLVWSWFLLRRLSLPIETAAGCGWGWFRYAWVPVALLPLEFALGLAGLATASRKTVHFQGERPGN